MDRLKELDAQYKAAQGKADEFVDERAIEIVREVDRIGKGGVARVAEALGVKSPTITHAVRRGRELIAQRAARGRAQAA